MLTKVTNIQEQWEEDECDEYVRGPFLLAMNIRADESATAIFANETSYLPGDCNESTVGSSFTSSPADKHGA